jgi:hypothetical protein
MFKSKTVFVIGAGASDEVDIPIGKELTGRISKLLNIEVDYRDLKSGDGAILETLRQVVQASPDEWPNETLLSSAQHLAEAMEIAPSIDTFLETFALDKERRLVGKLGIVQAILQAERGSKLAPTDDGTKPFRMSAVTATWYVSLAQLLFTGRAANDVGRVFENTGFVVFNYDRCLQVFLTRALQVYFRINGDQADEIVKAADIYHPYGSIGSVFPGPDQVPYGTERADLAALADRIKLFTEAVEEGEEIGRIRKLIREAETIIFLGFAFHEQNMNVLSPSVGASEKTCAMRHVLATTYGVSDSDIKVIRQQIGYTMTGRPAPTSQFSSSYTIDTFTGKCALFFSEYWRSFTA